MDKKLMLAVAGAGKTTFLINKLNEEKRFLIVTYTQNNLENLRNSIIEKFGIIPTNITLISFYTFLYSYCCKPFLQRKYKLKGIFWELPERQTNYLKRDNPQFYMTKNKYLYHNRISKLLEEENLVGEISTRLERYFDHMLIDEVQDFGGHDFNFFVSLSKANIDLLAVGDFYQHTFDTSRDGAINRTLHNDYNKYITRLKKANLEVDTETLKKSHRCSKSTCLFIADKLGIPMESHNNYETEINHITEKEKVEEIFNDNAVVKLFYQESYCYPCHSCNWGEVKGQNCYNDICIVLNKVTLKHYINGNLNELKPQTKNKLYVALSRAKRNIYFIDAKEIEHKQQKSS